MNQIPLFSVPSSAGSSCFGQSQCFSFIQRNCLPKSADASFVSDQVGHHQFQQQLHLKSNLLLRSAFGTVSRWIHLLMLEMFRSSFASRLLRCSCVAPLPCRCSSVCSKGREGQRERWKRKRGRGCATERRDSERTHSLVSGRDREGWRRES